MIDRGISSRPARSFRCVGQPEHVRLEHVLEEREPAGHVPVERRVADRELRLVAGGDDEPAELVRQRHQQHAADAGLEVLLGQVAIEVVEARRERLLEGGDDLVDRQLAEVDPEALREPPRVAAGALRREPRRHRDAVHPLGAERLDRERRGQRRVDPAGQPDDDVAKAVLLHVVAQPELEREPHLLEVVAEGRNRFRGDSPDRGLPLPVAEHDGFDPAAALRAPAPAPAVASRSAAVPSPRSGRRPRPAAPPRTPGPGRAPRPRRRGRPSGRRRPARPARRQRSRTRRSWRCRGRAAGTSPRARGPCRRGTARRRRSRAAARRRARDRSPAGPAATCPRRSSRRRATRPGGAGRGRGPRRSTAPRRRRRSSAGTASGRRLARHRPRRLRTRCTGRRRRREADERSDACRRGCDLVERPPGRAHECRPQEQVLGRIAGDRELGEEDEIRTRLARLARGATGSATGSRPGRRRPC